MFLKDLFNIRCPENKSKITQEPSLAEAAAMGRSKTIKALQESSNEGQKTSRTLEQKKELPFLEASSFMLTIAFNFGFHNVRRNSSGEFENSQWRLLPVSLHFMVGVVGFLVVQYLHWFTKLEYYQGIMLIPIEFGFAFCIESYITNNQFAKHYVKYLSEIEAQKVKILSLEKMLFVIVGVFIPVSSIIYTACILLVANLSIEITSLLLMPVLHTTLLPNFSNMFMVCFNFMLHQEVIKLREHMRQVSHWTMAEISDVASKWLQLCRLFRLHNRVRVFLPFAS